MDAIITGESERIGLSVIDNNNVEHLIEMLSNGDIKYHEQDAYPDKDVERTYEERVAVKHTRQFAKYHVYRERGYDTLEPRENPDRVAAVALALSDLSLEAYMTHFGEFYEQLKSHYTEGEPPVELPEGATGSNVVYQQDVYLGADFEATRGIATDSAAFETDRSPTASSDPAQPPGSDELAESSASDLPIEAVSGLRIYWDDRTVGEYRTVTTTEPEIGREPDVRLEMLPYDPPSERAFRDQCLQNIFCQVRDCYIGMGLTPPEPFQIRGYGKHNYATWYDNLEVYQAYHDPDSEIDWARS